MGGLTGKQVRFMPQDESRAHAHACASADAPLGLTLTSAVSRACRRLCACYTPPTQWAETAALQSSTPMASSWRSTSTGSVRCLPHPFAQVSLPSSLSIPPPALIPLTLTFLPTWCLLSSHLALSPVLAPSYSRRPLPHDASLCRKECKMHHTHAPAVRRSTGPYERVQVERVVLRSIGVDVRYVLWLVGDYDGATQLVDEMLASLA